MNKYYCPECESKNILGGEETLFEINTGEFYCHSVKLHDNDCEIECQDYGWTGLRQDLIKKVDHT